MFNKVWSGPPPHCAGFVKWYLLSVDVLASLKWILREKIDQERKLLAQGYPFS